MKAMLIGEGQVLNWSDVALPVPKAHEVLIEVYAAALNRADLLQRQGKYPSPPGCAPWMGLEVAGVVAGTGAQVARWKPGDRVCALLGGGGYAEYAVADEGMTMPMPAGLSFEEAASLPEAYATCYLNLMVEGMFKPGETLYFPAGASGLASAGIPMAKAFGAYVITSVLSAEMKARVSHLGADVVIDSSEEDLATVLSREAEKGHPVDVAIDCLGGEMLGCCLPFVNRGCRWILISTLAGVTTSIPLRAVLTKGMLLKGSMLRNRSVAEKSGLLARLVKDVWPLLEAGSLRPTVYRVLPITEAEQAHAILENGENVGKVVLKVRS